MIILNCGLPVRGFAKAEILKVATAFMQALFKRAFNFETRLTDKRHIFVIGIK